MDFQPTINPYERYEMAAQRFRETVAKKKDMEDHFHPSMVKDYNNVKAEMVRNAIELLRIGVQKRTDETNVYLTIEDEEYKISRADMMKAMDKKQWDDLFPSDNVQTIKVEIDNGEEEYEKPTEDEGYRSYDAGGSDSQNFQNNPLAAFITAIATPFMNGGTGQIDTGKMMLSLQQAFQPRPLELSDEIGDIQKRILRLEKQRDAALDEANRYHRQISSLQENSEETEQAHKEEIESIQKSLEDAKAENESINSKLEEARKKLSEKESNYQKTLNEQRNTSNRQLQDEKNRSKEVADSLNKKLEEIRNDRDGLRKQLDENAKKASEELEASLKKAKADADDAVKKARDEADETVKKARSDAEAKIAEISSRLSEAEEKLKKNSDEVIKKFEDKIKDKDKTIGDLEAKTRELEKKLKEFDEMKAEVEAGKKRQSELQNKISEQEQEIRSLAELAYNDRKAGVLNNNAFNRDFPAVEKDKDNTCLVITGVRNMRLINEKYGRAAGDEMLKVAAEACKKEFGENNVYRVFNDEFAIITKNDFSTLVNKLENTKDILSAQQISIVYGIAVGSKVPDIRTMVTEAENAMIAMKNSPMGGNPPIPETAPDFSNKKQDEPEDLDMSEMLEEYMQSGN